MIQYEYEAATGYLRLDTIEAGAETGSFAGRLPVLAGYLDVATDSITQGDLALVVRASDGEEETDCATPLPM